VVDCGVASSLLRSGKSVRELLGITLLGLFLLAHPASSQDATPPGPPSEPSPARSGLLDELGKLLKPPGALFSPSPASPPAAEPPAQTPSGAQTDAVPPDASAAPAPGSRIVPSIASGREMCPRAANGAPDCKAGADKLCQGKGFREGKSLDSDSAYGCSTKPLRAALAGERKGKLCGTEHYVTRAFCQ
jgi:hypothetical protein